MNRKPSIQLPLPPESRFEDQTLLPAGFAPSSMDVICQRGRQAYNHPGNRRFRLSISLYLKRYQEAPTKPAKSAIVNEIVDTIRENSANGGGFVRFNKDTSRWYEIGDVSAREKIGFTIREELRKGDSEYMDEKRSKRRELKKQRIAERNRSSMEAITAAIKAADKSLRLKETAEFSTVARESASPSEDSDPESTSAYTSDDDKKLEPLPREVPSQDLKEVPSQDLEPMPIDVPSQIQAAHAIARYDRLKYGDDHPQEVLPAVQQPELHTAKSRDWFTQDQMRRMSMTKEGEYSPAVQHELHTAESRDWFTQDQMRRMSMTKEGDYSPAVQQPELRTVESRDWFTQDQMRRMSMTKAGEYSGLFGGEKRSRSSSSSSSCSQVT